MDNKQCFLEKLSDYNEKDVISKGKLNGLIIHQLLSTCSKYPHLEIREYLYGDDLSDYEWCDVEGIGYGWRWCKFEDEPNDDRLRESLIGDIKEFVGRVMNKEFENDLYYIYSFYDGEYCFLFFNQTNDKTMYSYRFSDTEIDY